MDAEKRTHQSLIHAGKMGIAGIVSICAAYLLHLPQGYWAAISAFVVLGADVGTTDKASRDRLIGTAIGAIVGAAFCFLAGPRLLWFGLAVTVTVLICEVLGLRESYRLACVTVAIVMLISNAGPPWPAAVHRFLEVALGIVIALALSALPPRLPPMTRRRDDRM
jgi:uncharacterized membrane protein YccC